MTTKGERKMETNRIKNETREIKALVFLLSARLFPRTQNENESFHFRGGHFIIGDRGSTLNNRERGLKWRLRGLEWIIQGGMR